MKSKILIVDDIEVNLLILEKSLETLDALIIKANNGNEALELAQKYLPAVIVLDVEMPEVDGYEVADKLKLNNETKDIPIIFLTAAFQADEFVNKGYECGAADYMLKPFNPYILRSKIIVFLELNQRSIEIMEQNETILKQKHDLLRVNDELKVNNNILKDFSHTVAHDLRSPLATIHSSLTLLKTVPTDMSDKLIDMTVDSATRMLKLIEDLLIYAKNPEEASLNDSIDLNLVLTDVLADLSEKINADDITINVGELPTVCGGKTYLYQVFSNLISNSLKYRHADTPLHISIHSKKIIFKEREESVDMHEIVVEDNGLGIKPEDVQKVFQPFIQINAKTQGSGIGLATVKKIMLAHSGNIRAEPRPEGGTAMIICLPVNMKPN